MFELDKAYYYGTTIGRSWWRRYSGSGWLARGRGKMWADEGGIHFKRSMTSTQLTIPFTAIESLEAGKWHAGKWTGVEILKVVWKSGDQILISGYSLAKRRDEANKYRAMIQAKLDELG